MSFERLFRRPAVALAMCLTACSGEVLLGQELPPEQTGSPPATNTQPAGEPSQMQGDGPGTPGFGMGEDRRFEDGQFVDPSASAGNLTDEQWGLGRGEQFAGEQGPGGGLDVTDLESRVGDAGPEF